ncbi:hypothetical protein GOODEAATRI_009249 [Goodea atripinnis]|uniref:Uncharacterized protein n=1 Tax=Goodea atripinnis TaxID=208336 RepID=A0ABV0NT40_9TELE
MARNDFKHSADETCVLAVDLCHLKSDPSEYISVYCPQLFYLFLILLNKQQNCGGKSRKMLGGENMREEIRWWLSPNRTSVDRDERRISRELESPENIGSSLVVYPCKAKSLERALQSKSSELCTASTLHYLQHVQTA